MATLQSAKEKYRRVRPQAVVDYDKAMALFLGGPLAQQIVVAYDNGYQRATHKNGDAGKWAERYVAKMTGKI